MVNGQYARAKQILSEHKEGHNRLAQLLVEREVIMAEDVEEIFGKRPWVSRTDELLHQEENSQPKLEDMPEEVKQAQAEHEAMKAKEENGKASDL
jgi:ATP-dependent metallopeptidase hflB